MVVFVKYLILVLGLIAGLITLYTQNIGAGITSVGSLISFAIIEINDLKILNSEKE